MKFKMWDKIKLNEIRKDAKDSLKYKDFNANRKNNTYIWFLYVLPCLISTLLLIFGFFIEKEIANYLITSISIFAGLFFGLLFIVTDKYNQKKEYLKSLIEKGDEETKGYVLRYKNFSTILVRQIAFTIILAGILIMLMSVIYFTPQLPQFDLCWFQCLKTIAKYIINGLIYYWGVQFILFLLVILSNMYIMLLDDINCVNE